MYMYQSDVFSCQEEERSILFGVGSLEFITEPEPPLLLQFQPAHRLPQRATISTDDTQSRTYRRQRDRNCNYDTQGKVSLGCHILYIFHCLFDVCSRTFEEGELFEESWSHKGVSETEEKAAEEQPCGTDVDRMRSGAHETHRHLQESGQCFHISV